MINLYPERIAELHDFLEVRYGQRDRQATEILLACLMDVTAAGRARPWIILETDYPTRDMTYAWFAFGGVHPNVWSLAVPRVERKKTCEEIIHGWLEDRMAPATYVESEWRRLPPDLGEHARAPMTSGWRTIMSNEYRLLMSSCVRVRVEHPRGMAAAMDRDADRNELARLTSRVLDSSLGRSSASSSLAINAPASMGYWCELGQRLMPFMIDWDTLIAAMTGIARGIASLYNDGRPPDWKASERVLRDCVPWATTWIMNETDNGIAEGRKALKMFQAAGHTMDKPFKAEMRRLNRLGVILSRRGSIANYVYHPWRYRLASQDWKELLDHQKTIFR